MSVHQELDALTISRRNMICGGGSAVFSALVALLLDGSSPVRAAPLTGTVPEVDALAVRVIIDSYQFAVAPSKKLSDVDIQHFGWGIGDTPPDRTLISEFGSLDARPVAACCRDQKHPHRLRLYTGGADQQC